MKSNRTFTPRVNDSSSYKGKKRRIDRDYDVHEKDSGPGPSNKKRCKYVQRDGWTFWQSFRGWRIQKQRRIEL